LERTTFGEIQTLREMRHAWDVIASITMLWQVGAEPIDLNLQVGKDDRPSKTVAWKPSPDVDGLLLEEVGKRSPIEISDRSALFLEYDFLPALAPLAHSNERNSNALLHDSGLADDNGNLPKSVHLQVTIGLEKGPRFSPAKALDPILGKEPKFANAFPNLSTLPSTLQDEGLDSLGPLLQAAQQQKGELEVFGAKIPNELIALLGLPALAILLFQFSAVGFYVASNVEWLDQEEASEWSFLLRGWPFLIMSVGTIFVFPALASVLTFFFLPGENSSPKPITLALTIIVVMFGAVAFVAIQRLRSRVQGSGQAAQIPN
jgi:hypothetical protein